MAIINSHYESYIWEAGKDFAIDTPAILNSEKRSIAQTPWEWQWG